jgi:ADP-ribosylglycohydrolase
MMDIHDSFKACLLGGAIGDALGYPTLATADT